MNTKRQDKQQDKVSNALVRSAELLDLMEVLGGKVKRWSKTPDGAVFLLIRFADSTEMTAHSGEGDCYYLQ